MQLFHSAGCNSRNTILGKLALCSVLLAAGPAGVFAQEKQDSLSVSEEIFVMADQLPEPTFDLGQYLAQSVRYPPEAIKRDIQGRVTVQFVVDVDGSITNIAIIRDIGGGCGQEAARVVKGMPKWKPGRNARKPVRVYYTLPVSFRIQ